MTTPNNGGPATPSLSEVLALLAKATPGEWPRPVPSRFGTNHFVVEHHPLPHIAAIKLREDADAAVAAVNYLRSHGEAIAALPAKWRKAAEGINRRHSLQLADIFLRDSLLECADELDAALSNIEGASHG